jgi:DNA-binding NtrC family response regulator
VGGSQSLPADFRIIAATNRDLYQSVEVGSFRLDLYYRLNVFTIRLPPLRERREDIVALAHFFLARLARKLGRPACRFSEKAMQQLLQYDWPGNVRELENAIERAVVVQRGEEIRAGDLPLGPPPPRVEETSLAQLERRHIEEVLRQTAGNVSESARKLGIDRTTLYNKIRKYRLRRNQD